MSRRHHAWILAGACVLGIIAWIGGVQWHARPALALRAPAASPATQAATLPVPAPPAVIADPGCTLPPIATPATDPLQTPVPETLHEIALPAGHATPRAGFSVDARVLARRGYSADRQARFSPTDVALGWGPMADRAVLAKLDIAQSSRWYHYGWLGTPPIAPEAIARSSANMHMVPATPAIAAALGKLQPGQHVRIDGWLVDLHDRVGWNWNTSMTRDDRGEGACEIVYACRVAVIPE